MKKVSGFLLGLALLLGNASLASAQEKSEGMHTPPTVLTIAREFLKPGKSGAVHDRSESAFVRAMANAKSPTNYLALNAVSGKPRALFLTGYDSFAAWEKDQLDTAKNPTLSAALDRATEADGQLLDSYDQSAWIYRPDQSLNQTGDLVGVRYFEIESFRLKPGHEADWDAAVKLVKDAYSKAMPDAHWAMYENVFGLGSPAYLVITPRKSASEIDAGFQQGPKFMAAIGADGMKKLGELSAAAIESRETNLFTINPRQSYMMEDLMKADPDFWRPKAAPAAPKKEKPEAKP
ncbi:MAG TPA: hypothetical protein VN881_05960 [Candidatus Acidoferrales bacterium]|nr:hypothetical protein [Candidatus Acidoferrales bacterium]